MIDLRERFCINYTFGWSTLYWYYEQHDFLCLDLVGWWTKKTKNWVKTLLALGNVQGNLSPGKQAKLNYILDAFWCILFWPNRAWCNYMHQAYDVWLQLWWSDTEVNGYKICIFRVRTWDAFMFCQGLNHLKWQTDTPPQRTKINMWHSFILKRQDNWNCISKDHIPHLLEEIVLGEQVGFGVLAAAVVGFQHLHGHAGQAWIIKSLNCTEYQAMQSAIRR